MNYKGYEAMITPDADAGILHGEVLNTRDVITFQAESMPELRRAFEESVDDYLDFCQARGESPEKPFSGRLVLRINGTLHRQLATEARKQGRSLNALISDTLAAAVDTPQEIRGAR